MVQQGGKVDQGQFSGLSDSSRVSDLQQKDDKTLFVYLFSLSEQMEDGGWRVQGWMTSAYFVINVSYLKDNVECNLLEYLILLLGLLLCQLHFSHILAVDKKHLWSSVEPSSRNFFFLIHEKSEVRYSEMSDKHDQLDKMRAEYFAIGSSAG